MSNQIGCGGFNLDSTLINYKMNGKEMLGFNFIGSFDYNPLRTEFVGKTETETDAVYTFKVLDDSVVLASIGELYIKVPNDWDNEGEEEFYYWGNTYKTYAASSYCVGKFAYHANRETLEPFSYDWIFVEANINEDGSGELIMTCPLQYTQWINETTDFMYKQELVPCYMKDISSLYYSCNGSWYLRFASFDDWAAFVNMYIARKGGFICGGNYYYMGTPANPSVSEYAYFISPRIDTTSVTNWVTKIDQENMKVTHNHE